VSGLFGVSLPSHPSIDRFLSFVPSSLRSSLRSFVCTPRCDPHFPNPHSRSPFVRSLVCAFFLFLTLLLFFFDVVGLVGCWLVVGSMVHSFDGSFVHSRCHALCRSVALSLCVSANERIWLVGALFFLSFFRSFSLFVRATD